MREEVSTGMTPDPGGHFTRSPRHPHSLFSQDSSPLWPVLPLPDPRASACEGDPGCQPFKRSVGSLAISPVSLVGRNSTDLHNQMLCGTSSQFWCSELGLLARVETPLFSGWAFAAELSLQILSCRMRWAWGQSSMSLHFTLVCPLEIGQCVFFFRILLFPYYTLPSHITNKESNNLICIFKNVYLINIHWKRVRSSSSIPYNVTLSPTYV